MHILDFIIAIPLLYFMYKGAVNGIVKEILNIVGISLAIFLTFYYMDVLTVLIKPFFEEDASTYIPFISSIILFNGTLTVVAIIGYLTREFLKAVKLGTVNKVAGALFGLLKSGTIVSTILLLLSVFNIPKEKSRNESFLYAYIIYVAPWAYDAVAIIYPGAEGFTQTIQENLKNYNLIENLPFLNDN